MSTDSAIPSALAAIQSIPRVGSAIACPAESGAQCRRGPAKDAATNIEAGETYDETNQISHGNGPAAGGGFRLRSGHSPDPGQRTVSVRDNRKELAGGRLQSGSSAGFRHPHAEFAR